MTREERKMRPGSVCKILVECQSCHTQAEIEKYRCFDVAFAQDMKRQLKDSSFFQWICPKCGRYSELAYESQYLDEEGKLCVALYPSLETGNEEEVLAVMNQRLAGLGMKNIRHRAVGNFYGMQEQVRIMEEELDDRVVQLVKPLLIGQLQSRGFEIWNGFFMEKQQDLETGQEHVTYMFESNRAEEAYKEPILWFDIYLTNGEVIREGINFYTYRLCEQILEREFHKIDNGEFQLYDLSWAIKFHNQLRGE